MTTALEPIEQSALSTSEVIEASIPHTNDQGDALYAACQILRGSYDYCCTVGDLKVPQAVRMIVRNAAKHIGGQYAEYLKGGAR